MSETQIKLIHEAIRIIKRRSVDPKRNITQKTSYESAYDMLIYALEGNAECLAQYDDVDLRCEDCANDDEDGSTLSSYEALSMCNACENHEFFCPRR